MTVSDVSSDVRNLFMTAELVEPQYQYADSSYCSSHISYRTS